MELWQPNPQGIEEILGLLRNVQSPNSEVQRTIRNRLDTLNAVPEYSCYLAYVFGVLKNEDEMIRTAAGLILKNNIKQNYGQLPPEKQAFIREATLGCIGDPTKPVRNTAGTIIATMALLFGLASWPNLMATLYQLLDHQDGSVVSGAFGALYKLCEECAQQLEASKDRPLNHLIPKFLAFFKSPVEEFRNYAISCVNHFLLTPPSSLLINMETYLEGLFFLTRDPSVEVQIKVCNAFTTLIEVRREVLLPNIYPILEYILASTQSNHENLALAACEFWTAIADTTSCKAILEPVLVRLLDVLLNGMRYSEEEIAAFEMERDDASQPDQAKDIRPRFHKSSKGNLDGDDNDDDDDDEDDDDDDDDDEQSANWNLRKSAASGLDILSSVYRDELLPPFLEKITPRLVETNPWPIREAAILALGAVAEGCFNGMQPHLSQLVSYLLGQLSSPEPLIRSISCWSLSRYSKWIVVPPNADQFFKPSLERLLNCILDKSKRVQEAACSAFATLEEETRHNLIPYLEVILQSLMFAFERYQAKNLLILYDAIGTLADSVGPELNKPQYLNILMPPIIKKWNEIGDMDRSLCPLLECLTSITIALGPGFEPFAAQVIERCARIVESSCMALAIAEQGLGDEPDRDFMVCALDLISGVIEAIHQKAEIYIQNTHIPQLLLQCMRDSDYDVKQSAFAMIGDIAKTCINQLKEILGQVIPVLINNINLEHTAVCNNACWALGEIATRVGDAITPYVSAIMSPLTNLIRLNSINRGLMENIAISIGRLADVVPQMIAPHIEGFIANWCLALRLLRDNEDREIAFRGLVKVIAKNPDGIIKNFIFICDAIASWTSQPPKDLNDNFYQILHGFKTSAGPAAWNQYFYSPQFPESLRSVLQQKYGI